MLNWDDDGDDDVDDNDEDADEDDNDDAADNDAGWPPCGPANLIHAAFLTLRDGGMRCSSQK